MANIIETVKKAALDAVRASKPCEVYFGEVENVLPLIISVDQKLKLTSTQLIQIRDTELNTSDTVILLRVQGGQKFVLLGVMI